MNNIILNESFDSFDNYFIWLEKNYFENLNKIKEKPNWNYYYLRLAKLAATRSVDPNTKHGCILTDKNHRVISVGYNGPIQGIDDFKVPLERPLKYNWIIHAEMNSLLFCFDSFIDNGFAYITGIPCSVCLLSLIQKGIKKIFYGDLNSACISSTDIEEIYKIAKESKIELVKIKI